jgi:carbon starvation protein CstA
MNSIWKVSDTEVSSAIRYLDPDLLDDNKNVHRETELRSRRRVKTFIVIFAIAAILYITALKYWPAFVRLLS